MVWKYEAVTVQIIYYVFLSVLFSCLLLLPAKVTYLRNLSIMNKSVYFCTCLFDLDCSK